MSSSSLKASRETGAQRSINKLIVSKSSKPPEAVHKISVQEFDDNQRERGGSRGGVSCSNLNAPVTRASEVLPQLQSDLYHKLFKADKKQTKNGNEIIESENWKNTNEKAEAETIERGSMSVGKRTRSNGRKSFFVSPTLSGSSCENLRIS